jgi:hypothetical protein
MSPDVGIGIHAIYMAASRAGEIGHCCVRGACRIGISVVMLENLHHVPVIVEGRWTYAFAIDLLAPCVWGDITPCTSLPFIPALEAYRNSHRP